MRLSFTRVLGILLAFFLMGALVAPQVVQAQDKPSGRVNMTIGQGGFVIGGSGGKGTLTFRGRTYGFKLGGIGFGQFGGSKAVCTGTVYNLTRVEDFSGAYGQLDAGATGVKGVGEFWLKNTKGVELHLRSRTKGFEVNAGAQGVVIELNGPKR